MYLYIQLWEPLPQWKKLSIDDRAKLLKNVFRTLLHSIDPDIELVGFVAHSKDNKNNLDRWTGVWKIPNEELISHMQNLIEESGWTNFFKQDIIFGDCMMIDEAVWDMIWK